MLLHGPLVISKNSVSCLKLFVRYSRLKNPAFWLVQRFLDYNSRNRFFPTFCFWRKLKYYNQKSIYTYIKVDKILHTLKTSFLGLFERPKSIWTFFKGLSLFLLYNVYQIVSQGLIQSETTVSRKASIWSKGNKDGNKIKLE